MNQVATIATLLSIVLSVIAFSTILYKIVNRTPKLTAKKVHKCQKRALSEVIKKWNNDILQAAAEGRSGIHIRYYGKNYSAKALESTVKYFRLQGFDVRYTLNSAYISWDEEENQC